MGRLLMRAIGLLLAGAIALAGCGFFGGDDPESVRFDWIGWDGETLAITYDHGGHFHVGVSEVLQIDSDEDRPVRVVMKEFCRCRQWQEYPEDLAADWYTHSGDHKEPYAPVPEDEAAWLSRGDPLLVETPHDPLLAEWVEAARLRINEAAGFEFLRRPP